MSQIYSVPFYNTRTGVNHSSRATILTIPYSSTGDKVVNGELKVYAETTISGAIGRLYFVLPFYYLSFTSSGYINPGDILIDDGTGFSKLIFSDFGSTSTFGVELLRITGASPQLEITMSAPNTGTDWIVYAYADVFRQV